jgi:hypothetical protein
MRTEPKPRGRPFPPGNPGRPRGAKNKTTEIVERLAEGQAEKLIEKVLELAQAGDVTCLRMVFDRLWPLRKGRPVDIDIPAIKSSNDVLNVIVAIWTAVRQGRLTPEEAGALSLVAERSVQAVQIRDILKRLEDLEQEREGGERP